MTTYRTTITGALDRLEVDPGVDVELDDVIYGIVKLKVSSETDKMTADGETRTVALAVQDFAAALDESTLLTALKRSIVARAADRDRAAGRPPIELDGETVDGDVEAELDEATTKALEELDELERELTGEDGPDDELEVDPEGADEVAPDGQADPFEPDEELELEVDEDGDERPLPPVDPDGGEREDGPSAERYLAVDGVTVTEEDLEAARSRVVAAFGTDYVDEPSTAIREDLLGLEHVAAWLLRDLRVVEQAAGARPEVLEYLDGRLAATLERYATEDPWKGYRSATVGTIAGTLERRRPEETERGNWPELAEHVRAFELAGKSRKGVLDIVDGMLETIPETDLPTPDPGFEPTEDPAGDEADR